MVLNGNKCANALYNKNYKELHLSTLMGFWQNEYPDLIIHMYYIRRYLSHVNILNVKIMVLGTSKLWSHCHMTTQSNSSPYG